MTGDGRFVEVQSTAEKVPFDRARLDELLDLAAARDRRARRAATGGRSMHLVSSVPTLDGWNALLRLAVACGLGAAIGFEREIRDREAGHPHASARVARLGALHDRLRLRLPRVPGERRQHRPHRPDAHRRADRHRHRLPRRRRDHPRRPVHPRAHDRGDAVGRRGDRHGVRRRVLLAGRGRDRADDPRALAAAPARLPADRADQAGGEPPHRRAQGGRAADAAARARAQRAPHRGRRTRSTGASCSSRFPTPTRSSWRASPTPIS